ncbi:histidine phosphatase family protein [Agarivorans sp. MS3-6]
MYWAKPSELQVVVLRLCLLISLMVLATNHAQANQTGFWDELKSSNHLVLLRHAIAPGNGDPTHFDVNDCSTQRNLSPEGQQQASAIGEQFRLHGIDRVRVFSSQWCRCLDTARLLKFGEVKELLALNSFYRQFQRQEQQTQTLKEWLAQQNLTLPTVLVTHQVNITALTGVYPQSGELILVKRREHGEVRVVARKRINPH